MLMSTDVASIMLPVSRALMDRELETMAGVHPNAGGSAGASVRGMKRGDPEPDALTAAALLDAAGAECKRPRIDGIPEVGQVRRTPTATPATLHPQLHPPPILHPQQTTPTTTPATHPAPTTNYNHPAPYTHSYTLHPAPTTNYTHPAPYTHKLHPSYTHHQPYTLHPAPYTHHKQLWL